MSCQKCQTFKQNTIVSLWRLCVVSIPYFIFYTWLANVVNRLYLLFSGEAATMSSAEVLSSTPILKPIVSVGIPLPGYLAEALIACVVMGIILYAILDYICNQEWVQEPVEIEECWEEIKWYNPFSWVKAIFCTIVEVLKWVLKQVCKWKATFVLAMVIICGVVSIIILL